LDVSPFPASVRGDLFWDGEPLLRDELDSLHFTNKPGRYVPGACRFLANGRHVVNVAEPLKGSFGRCEVDLEIPWHLSTPGQYVVELRVTCANAPHAVVKAFSRFEITVVEITAFEITVFEVRPSYRICNLKFYSSSSSLTRWIASSGISY
jgi:hypothetical protein